MKKTPTAQPNTVEQTIYIYLQWTEKILRVISILKREPKFDEVSTHLYIIS